MITVTSTTNAPGTTIQVHSISLNLVMYDNSANLNVNLYDGYGQLIRPPQPIRRMTGAELTTFLAVTATSGETMAQLVARAASAYVTSAYGITYST